MLMLRWSNMSTVDSDSTAQNETMNLQELTLNSQKLMLGKMRSHLIQRCHHLTKPISLQLRNMKIYVVKMPHQKLVKPRVFVLLLMEQILHQLRLVVYPIIYKVLNIPGGAGFLPSTVCSFYL